MPAKNHCFLVVIAGKAGNNHQKVKISGRLRLPEPLHRVSRVIEMINYTTERLNIYAILAQHTYIREPLSTAARA